MNVIRCGVLMLARAAGLSGLLLAMAGCGGGGGDGVGSGGTGTQGTPVATSTASVTVGPITGFGSVIVAGVRYDSTGAMVDDSTGRALTSDALRLGMYVELTGSTRDDGLVGTAGRIRVVDELRGPVSSVDLAGAGFVALGITVKLTASTVLANLAGLADLLAGDLVEVHGRTDPLSGVVTATRVERFGPSQAVAPFDARNRVQALDRGNRRFVLGTMTIDYSTVPGGLPDGVDNGRDVRVAGAARPVSGVWQVASVERIVAPGAADGSRGDLECRIASFVSQASFSLCGVAVDAGSATLTGGTAASLANGVTAHAVGTMAGGVLRASRLTLESDADSDQASEDYELHGSISGFLSAASFVVRNTPVDASGAMVRFSNGRVGDLADGRSVEIHGVMSAGRLRATEVVFGD